MATKQKDTFRYAVGVFLQSNTTRRGHVEFIQAAQKHLKEFGIHKDINTYKSLLDLFPKGKMVPENKFQKMLLHYPKQQYACLELLDIMSDNHVIPDMEVRNMVLNAFGRYSRPDMKIRRMLFWMPKFKYANPFDIPRDLPDRAIDLAQMAVKMMCRDPGTDITTWSTSALENCEENEWIVSGQSVFQKQIISNYRPSAQLMLQGPYLVWLRDERLQYFQLLAEPDESVIHSDFIEDGQEQSDTAASWKSWARNRRRGALDGRRGDGDSDIVRPVHANVHQQKNETILAIACTATSSKSSAAAWLQFLTRENPNLANISVQIQIRHRAGGGAIVETK